MGIVEFHTQSFQFSETEIGPRNLHFQVPQRCWALTLRTTECHLPSPWEDIPCICCLFSISHFKSYSHLSPHSIPETANGIRDPGSPISLGLYSTAIIKKEIHTLCREHWKTQLPLYQGFSTLALLTFCMGLSFVVWVCLVYFRMAGSILDLCRRYQ